MILSVCCFANSHTTSYNILQSLTSITDLWSTSQNKATLSFCSGGSFFSVRNIIISGLIPKARNSLTLC